MSHKKAYYAGGCFWGVEHLFQGKDGVLNAVSGYLGGSLDNPTYQDVLTGKTGHLEAVEITYDPDQVSYQELTKFFFEPNIYLRFFTHLRRKKRFPGN